MFLFGLLGLVFSYTICEHPYCPPGSSLEEGQWCWWLAQPGSYWVCNGTDHFDYNTEECVNAYVYNKEPCKNNYSLTTYNNTLMCVEYYNQTESECPQGYTLDVPGEGRWTCDMWTTPLCNQSFAINSEDK